MIAERDARGIRRGVTLAMLVLCAACDSSDTSEPEPMTAQVNESDAAAEVMLFGVFHFANPNRDVVRVEQVDVLTDENQTYLAALADRLCEFRPTAILLEYEPLRDQYMQAIFGAWNDSRLAREANEHYQIGFRVAKACGVERIYGFDESEIGWNAEPLFEYLQESEPAMLAELNRAVAAAEAEESQARRDLSLRGLLLRANDPQQDRANKDFYLLINAAGAGARFEGADATARWWHRNIRMYANIQRYALPGERLLVVAGSGHTAILKDFLATDRRLLARDVREFL